MLAGEGSRNPWCSLAGSGPSWRNEEQFQLRVRKHGANVDSFMGAGAVGKARSGCFAARLNVPWMAKTAKAKPGVVLPPKNPRPFLESCHCSASSWASGYTQSGVSACGCAGALRDLISGLKAVSCIKELRGMKEDCLMAPLPVWPRIHVLPWLPDKGRGAGGSI